MGHAITVFGETVICTLAFCILSLTVPTGQMNTGPSGIYLEAAVPWGITFGTLAIGAEKWERHERGHMIQHEEIGLFYWPIIALPSLFSAATNSLPTHLSKWYEAQATEYGNELAN